MCALATSASADDPSIWDRTYKANGMDNSSTCPGSMHDVTVKNGRFSIPWDMKFNDKAITVGHIDGTVRKSGLATITVTLDPLSREAAEVLKDESDTPEVLRKKGVKVEFQDHHGGREIHVYTADMCDSAWTEDRAGLSAPAEGGTVSCDSGPYAVALWSTKKSYRTGEYARVALAGEPTRLYRCVDACKAGTDPLARVEVHEVQPWAFIGVCAGQKTAAPPLPAAGAAVWDGTYGEGMMSTQDWRCPTDAAIKKLVVTKGKFSLPWLLSADRGYSGEHRDDAPIGRIDGVIAADGKTTLRVTFTITELPPEIIEKVHDATATLEYVRTLKPTMKFESDGGKMNPSGQGRKATLSFDGDQCEYHYEASEYKRQQFKESDGWKVDCYSYEKWKADGKYKYEDEAIVGGGLYECNASGGCTARPGRSSQWKRVGACGKQ